MQQCIKVMVFECMPLFRKLNLWKSLAGSNLLRTVMGRLLNNFSSVFCHIFPNVMLWPLKRPQQGETNKFFQLNPLTGGPRMEERTSLENIYKLSIWKAFLETGGLLVDIGVGCKKLRIAMRL